MYCGGKPEHKPVVNKCMCEEIHAHDNDELYHAQNKIEHRREKYDDILFRMSSGTDGHLIPKKYHTMLTGAQCFNNSSSASEIIFISDR